MPNNNFTNTLTLTAGGGTQDYHAYSRASAYFIVGLATLTSNWTIQSTIGTLSPGTEFRFTYSADITLDGNTITVFGVTMPSALANKDHLIIAIYTGSAWDVTFISDLSENSSIPLLAMEQNPFRPIPAVSEVMINGDDSPEIFNSVQGEGTTSSILHYRCDPVEKVLEIIGMIQVNTVDETTVVGSLSVSLMTWGTVALEPSSGAGLNDRYPVLLGYTLNGSTNPVSMKGGYITKVPNFSTIDLIVPSGTLGTDTNCIYEGKVNLKFRYSI